MNKNIQEKDASPLVGKVKENKISMKEFESLEIGFETNKVATQSQINEIKARFLELGIPDERVTLAFVDITLQCADMGSSDQTKLVGNSAVNTKVRRESLVAVIKNTCSLRQFCAYYAKIVWNLLLSHNRPPANWHSKGFRDSEKYAAFDFFFGVDHESSINPAEGLYRKPTEKERIANESSKEVSIYRQIYREGNNALNLGEVTGGKAGYKASLNFGKLQAE
nr:coat protein [Garlic yellow mosaic-associated virus]